MWVKVKILKEAAKIIIYIKDLNWESLQENLLNEDNKCDDKEKKILTSSKYTKSI